jgi:hydrogenase maturation protease
VNCGDARARVLVAGIGNVFFGDDGFGVSVAEELARHDLPPGVVVRDIGIRGLHLAYDLLEEWDLLVVVDAVAKGGAPGTLHVIEPTAEHRGPGLSREAHGMDLPSILDAARSLGASVPPVLVVGCDVANVSEGIGLTPEVRAAVERAARLVASLVQARPEPTRSFAAIVTKEECP